MKGIIFDVDGTLWDSTEMVAVAWNKVIKDEGIEHKELEEKDLKKEFGKPMEAIGESLFPEMPKDEMMKLMEKMLKYENGLVAAGPCVIFEGTSAPPEFPALMAASVCMKLSTPLAPNERVEEGWLQHGYRC